MNDMNKGYTGWSMSRRATEAYEDGYMPMSKWTKAAILAAIAEKADDEDLVVPEGIEKMTKAALVEEYLEYMGWHHTSKFCNETEFYGIRDLDDFAHMTPAQIAERDARYEAERRARLAAAKAEAERRAKAEAEWRAAEKAEEEFVKAHGYYSNSAYAYATAFPEYGRLWTSKKGTEMAEFDFGAFAKDHEGIPAYAQVLPISGKKDQRHHYAIPPVTNYK